MLFFVKNILVHIVAPESHVLIYLKLACFDTYQGNKKQTNNSHYMHPSQDFQV